MTFVLPSSYLKAVSLDSLSKSTAMLNSGSSQGSGFFVGERILVTNYHVVENGSGTISFKTKDGREDVGVVVAKDKKNDLAIIVALEGKYDYLDMGNFNDIKLGEDIYVISSPKGFSGSISKGVVAAIRKKNEIGKNLLQITASISPGSSGSPIISSSSGKVLGVVRSFYEGGQNLNFGIPVNVLKKFYYKNKKLLDLFSVHDLKFSKILIDFDSEESKRNLKNIKNPIQQFFIGAKFLNRKDYDQAIHWFKKSAKQGDVESQYKLGYIYGGSTPIKKYKKALFWLRRASERGHSDAQFLLGEMYLSGRGTSQNFNQAIYWLKRSAYQGDEMAQLALGALYFRGGAVSKDYVQAYKWSFLASNQEDRELLAKNVLDEIKKSMTPSQIAKAQELASKFRARNSASSEK